VKSHSKLTEGTRMDTGGSEACATEGLGGSLKPTYYETDKNQLGVLTQLKFFSVAYTTYS